MHAIALFQEWSLPTTLCFTLHIIQLIHHVMFLIYYNPPRILGCSFKFLLKNIMSYKGASQHFVP